MFLKNQTRVPLGTLLVVWLHLVVMVTFSTSTVVSWCEIGQDVSLKVCFICASAEGSVLPFLFLIYFELMMNE